MTRSKTKGGKLAISNPILKEDENTQNPLKKIATIDLAEAASNERMRREKYAQRASNLVALRPAPRAPSPPPDPATLLARQGIAGELQRSESVKSNETSSGLSIRVDASSTGTQLSPGVEAIRRRSPREPEPLSVATPFKVIRPGEPIRIPIPRPREPDPDTTPPKPEPVKTPLQRRPTTGLPSNPRAQALKTLIKEGGSHDPQTVMFVNNIVYDNPNTVGEIIQGVPKVPQPPDSGDSVVNRPRPISRKGDKDRQVFPAEISHHHTRSKSGGSLVNRKSILQVAPGSPTGLPSLPPIPPRTNAVEPNKTKSMTVEEKMDLLYQPPSSAPSKIESQARRRSSVPNMPPIPANLQHEHMRSLSSDGSSDSESGHNERESRASKRTTVRTSSILGVTVNSPRTTRNLNVSSSIRNPADELGSSWLPGIPYDAGDDSRLVTAEVKRRSSPVLPIGRQMSTSTARSEAQTVDEETITNWGSVYSPVVPVMRQNARSTYIGKDPRNAATYDNIPIVMMDEFINISGEPDWPSDSESDASQFGKSRKSQHLSGQFHHRVGDECPTFSTRKDKTRSRKMPPPTPLLLSGHTTKRAIVVQPAEPSPVDSPTAAYEVIKAQLRNIDRPPQGSAESPGQRLALLENLEQEMGQLESRWQSTHNKLDRDSMSSMPSQGSRPASIAPQIPEKSSRRSSVISSIAERRASRKLRLQLGGEYAEKLALPPQMSLQANLNSGQVQDSGNTPKLLARHENLNILSVSKAMLGSPSPPETDSSDWDSESGIDDVLRDDAKKSVAPIPKLWSPTMPTQQHPSTSWLWSPQHTTAKKQYEFHELPAISIRQPARKRMVPLTIESSRLWQKMSKPTSVEPQGGLWNCQSLSRRLSSTKRVTRPVTMRPPRKHKRISVLPDIIENPQPLPDKRDTLGIFQFPWGERSEHATMQYRPSQAFMAMPGTMTTGRSVVIPPPEIRARQPEVTEYSSSFFDEYDEEEEGDNFSDFSGSGDDDFDETTLWEIASLLKTDQVPSKNSLLPISSQSSPSLDTSILAEYVRDIPSDDEHDDDGTAEVPIAFDIAEIPKEQYLPTTVAQSLLWAPKHTSESSSQSFGLHQHETFNSQLQASEPLERKRSQPASNDISLGLLQSDRLWSPTHLGEPVQTGEPSWSASKKTSEPQARPSTIAAGSARLWAKRGATDDSTTRPDSSTIGLPTPVADVWQNLIAQNEGMNRSKPQIEASLPVIQSSELWSTSNADAMSSSTTGSSEGGLWEPATQTATLRPMPLSMESSHGLWKQVVRDEENSESHGLFDPQTTRRDFRRTSKLPAAILTSTKPRPLRHEPAPTLTSGNLWTARHMKPAVVTKDNTKISLWQPKPAAMVSAPPSLFTIDTERRDYRTTTAEPAALVIIRKPRLIREPLQRIESSHLWMGSEIVHVEMNWIALCTTIRSASPSPSVSVSTSSSLSDKENNASAKTTPTVAPSTASSKAKQGFFSGWFGKKTANKEPIPVPAMPSEQAQTQTQTTTLADVKDDNGALPEEFIIKDLDKIHPSTSKSHVDNRRGDMQTLRASHPRDWDVQLREAIAASQSHTVGLPNMTCWKQVAATPRDWSAALHEAMMASYYPDPELRFSRGQSLALAAGWGIAAAATEPRDRYAYEKAEGVIDGGGGYDASVRHPVFMVNKLESAAEAVHPAMMGYHVAAPLSNKEKYDVAVRHPVFFGSSAALSSSLLLREGAHPAALRQPHESARLWSKPSASTSISTSETALAQSFGSTGLWSPRSETSSRTRINREMKPILQNEQAHDLTTYHRKSKSTYSHTDMDMGSVTETFTNQGGLWKRGNGWNKQFRHPSSFEKNWLHDSVNQRFTRIVLRY